MDTIIKFNVLLKIQYAMKNLFFIFTRISKTMSKKNIIIVGYPKSGTTWLSRLVAELASCPLIGDWGFDHVKALYKEGEERISTYNCYKTHYTYNAIFSAKAETVFKIIHVIRDPRDVVISGSYYFKFSSLFQKILQKFGLITNHSSIFNVSYKKRKRRMIHAILHGDASINSWLSLSWLDHLASFKDKDVLTIKYEDMLIRPKEECIKIMSFLNLKTDDTHILNSIKNQSINTRKKASLDSKNVQLQKLIREGKQGYWKNNFTKQEKVKFELYLKNTSFYN